MSKSETVRLAIHVGPIDVHNHALRMADHGAFGNLLEGTAAIHFDWPLSDDIPCNAPSKEWAAIWCARDAWQEIYPNWIDPMIRTAKDAIRLW